MRVVENARGALDDSLRDRFAAVNRHQPRDPLAASSGLGGGPDVIDDALEIAEQTDV